MQTWFILSAAALLFFGITGVTQKLSTNETSFEMSFVWFCVAMFVISAAIPLFGHENWRVKLPLIGFAALGGLLNGLGVLTSFAALEKGGKASVVIPIINLYPLVTVAAAYLFLGEELTARQGLGIGFALAAVVLLSQETQAR